MTFTKGTYVWVGMVARVSLGALLALIVFSVTFKVCIFLVRVLGGIALNWVGVSLAESPNALANLEAFANIFGFILGIGCATKVYKRVNRKKAQSK